jgi:dTDP-L-rhamnose 4-epimerase
MMVKYKSMNYKTILVTGGAGFIGSHTTDLLINKGYKVKIIDNLQNRVHPHGKPKYINKNAKFIRGDVSNPKHLLAAMQDVDAIFHLAAYQDYMPDFSKYIHTNTESSALIFELIYKHNLPVKKVIFASSQAVSGDGKWKCKTHGKFWATQRSIEQMYKGEWAVKCPVCKNDAINILMTEDIVRPITTYGISKYSIELLANVLGSKYNIPTVCMRYTYVQGPRNSIYNAYSGIARVTAMRILNNKPPILFEDGLGLRDYINVSDVATANLLVLEDDRANYNIYFVGGGKAYTAIKFAKTMLKVFNSNLTPQIPGIFRVGDTRSTVSSIKKLSKLGWKPKVDLETSLTEYKNWLITQQNLNDKSDIAMRKMIKSRIIRKIKTTHTS